MYKTLHFTRLDFLTIKQYLTVKQLGLYAVIILFLSYTLDNLSFVMGMIMMYGLFYAAYPFAIGDKTQTDILYTSLPIKRQHVVFGRYLFALSINLLTAFLSLLITALIAMVFQKDFDLASSVLTVLICFFLYSLIEAIQFPIYFKLGYTKAKAIAFLPIMLIPLLIVTATTLIAEEVWKSALIRLTVWIEANWLMALFIVLLFWGLILLASMQLSYRIYQKREF